MKKITLLMATMALSMVSMATPIVGMSGIYTIGTTGTENYASLKAATDALNTSGMSGNVVFEITTDLLETASSYIGVNTGSYSIIIRPNADADRKIEFNKAADNAKASGLIIIGMSADSWDNLSTNTQNVIIDGFAVGGTTRRLTLATTTAANIYHGPIQIVGNSKYIIVKNCILTQQNLTSGNTTYAIRIRVEKNTASTVFAPSDITIENNVITAVANTAQMGIGLTFATGLTTNTLKNVIIQNNEILARTRCISMSNNENIVISGNKFSTEQTSSGMLSCWIQGISNGVGNVTITKNKFISGLTANVASGDFGFKGIIASGGGTWYIDNNFFTGFRTTGAPAAPGGLTQMIAIRCGNTCLLRNNSFLMNALNANVNLTPTYQGILIAAGTPEIKNNILISNEDAVTNTLISGTVGGITDYNNYFLSAGNTNARINSTHTTFGAYRTANPTKDSNSKNVDVNFVDVATGDLRIAGLSIQDNQLRVPSLVDVTTDIFGTVRNTEYTYAGAHESTLPFLTTEVDNAKAIPARIIRTSAGIEVQLNREANVELYTINGMLIDKARANGTYSRNLNAGIYIIRIDGKSTKFVK
jgi:hypothetical protein